MTAHDFSANVERFSGFADQYESVRPQPPRVLLDILTQVARVSPPQLVIDLGSGTGISTRFWQSHAARVIGVEPSDDMRREAARQTTAPNVEYCAGFSHDTGVPDECADIVTCSQSFHWMEPQSTLREAARILRPGGVFAAYDCDWPPLTSHWQADAEYERVMEQILRLEEERHLSDEVKRWSKSNHLAQIKASDQFRYAREIVMHHVEPGNADRFIGIALSQGGTRTLLKNGLSEDEIGITHLREVAGRTLGVEPKPWYWSYRVRLGIK